MNAHVQTSTLIPAAGTLSEEERIANLVCALLERGANEKFAEVLTITPHMAALFLDANTNNRKLSHRNIEAIVGVIQSDQWKCNGETIIVANNGELNDGQHRLEAIVQSGIPVESFVAFGVERKSRDTVDIGRVRTVGDIIAMDDDAPLPRLTASVARLLMQYEKGEFSCGSTTETKTEVIQAYRESRAEIDDAVAKTNIEDFGKRWAPTAVEVGYILINRTCLSPTVVEEFFAGVLRGVLLSAGDPRLVLRTTMAASRSAKLRSADKLEMILRYWNAWRAGKKLCRAIPMDRSYPKVISN